MDSSAAYGLIRRLTESELLAWDSELELEVEEACGRGGPTFWVSARKRWKKGEY